MNQIIKMFAEANEQAKAQKAKKFEQRKECYNFQIGLELSEEILDSLEGLEINFHYQPKADTMNILHKGKLTNFCIYEGKVDNKKVFFIQNLANQERCLFNQKNLIQTVWKILGLVVGKVDENDLKELYKNKF